MSALRALTAAVLTASLIFATSFISLYPPLSPISFLHSQRCKNAFIDVGTNHGMAIKDFLESKKWDFVDLPRDSFCIFGFEGNPVFTEELGQLEKKLQKAGVRAEFFTETVVDVDPGTVTFFLDTVNTKSNFWGSSLIKEHWDVKASGGQGVNVKAINLGSFILDRVDPSGYLFIKMDIEGAEYRVLNDLILSGSLCRKSPHGDSYVDAMAVEFHSIGQMPNGTLATQMELQKWQSFAKTAFRLCDILYTSVTD